MPRSNHFVLTDDCITGWTERIDGIDRTLELNASLKIIENKNTAKSLGNLIMKCNSVHFYLQPKVFIFICEQFIHDNADRAKNSLCEVSVLFTVEIWLCFVVYNVLVFSNIFHKI